jgi:ribosomal protein L40E
MTDNTPRPATYRGVRMRSLLEADWAATLDAHGIGWEYETELVELPSGARYLPDFWLPGITTVLEVKGTHLGNLPKVREFAASVPGFLVVIGWPPHTRNVAGLWDPYMVFSDAETRPLWFTTCLRCGAHQWQRGERSGCRRCGAVLGGACALSGELRFTRRQEELSIGRKVRA